MKTLVLVLALLAGVSSVPSGAREVEQLEALYVIPVARLTSLTLDSSRDAEVTSGEEDSASEELNQQLPSAGFVRSRRSTQPGGGGGGAAADRGHVEVGVSRGEGGGRRVEARGEGNVWQSRDGRGRVDVHGHYSRDYGGRHGTGRPQYGAGVRYSHRFR